MAARKKCNTCQYRAQENMPNNCDYILITGHMRKCDPERCDKYVNGKRLPWIDDKKNKPEDWCRRSTFILGGKQWEGRK